ETAAPGFPDRSHRRPPAMTVVLPRGRPGRGSSAPLGDQLPGAGARSPPFRHAQSGGDLQPSPARARLRKTPRWSILHVGGTLDRQVVLLMQVGRNLPLLGIRAEVLRLRRGPDTG